MHKIHLDFETFSKAPLPDVGAARYAADSSTEVLMCAVALDDAKPLIWLPRRLRQFFSWHQSEQAEEIFRMWKNPDILVYAHNAPFEVFISNFCLDFLNHGIEPPKPHQWRCTMAMARIAGLPQGLGDLAEVLRLAEQKDKEGKRLIDLFCKIQKVTKKQPKLRILPQDEPEEFFKFASYCLQDVATERDVEKKLAPFDLKQPLLNGFIFDMVMNLRGIPINIEALENARKLVVEAEIEVNKKFSDITGLKPSQNVKVGEWFRSQGYPYKSMDAAHVEKALESLEKWGAKACLSPKQRFTILRALELKQLASFAATKKIDKMLNCVCDHTGRVHGTFNFYGAGTGRWSARLIQPQNFKRSTKDTPFLYDLLCKGDLETFKWFVGDNVIESVSQCIRHFVHDIEANEFLDADFASVEGRGVCWLAGQEDALELYRQNADSYVEMAMFIFAIPASEVGFVERFIGKQTVLGCGYQMGPRKFLSSLKVLIDAYKLWPVINSRGLKIDMALAKKAVYAFRAKYNLVAAMWKDMDIAARAAVINPNKRFHVGKHLSFISGKVNGLNYLLLRLPSGRNLFYPAPKIETVMKEFEEEDDQGNTIKVVREVEAITFYGQLEGSQKWGRVQTYGGKLTENATQAICADLMMNGANKASEAGFEIFMVVHDQALALKPTEEHLNIQKYIDCLTDLPEWAEGFPLAAEGGVVNFYTKD